MAWTSTAQPMTVDDPVPTELNTSNHGPSLEIGKDKLTVRYTGDGRHPNDVGAIQANLPLPTNQLVYYFEMTVLNHGEHGRIALGFTEKSFKLTRQPGWEPGSYGYHGDDGRKYHYAEKGGEEYGPTFSTGDTVGAGIHLGRQEMFFTKNGSKLRVAFRGVKGVLFPTIGLHSKNECVEVNFGQAPFKFDLEGMVSDEKEQQAATVSSIPVPAGVVHQLVHSYLLHYGYAETLTAFDQAAGLAGMEQPMGVSDDPEVSSLACRNTVRQAILGGDVEAAVQLLQQHYPATLTSSSSSLADDLQFNLGCQRYIELLRQGQVNEAVLFAQTRLTEFQHKATHYEAQLRDVIALVAYERPEEGPLHYLLALSQREQVADVVNRAVLSVAGASSSSSGSSCNGDAAGCISQAVPQSALELLLQQLVAVHDQIHEENGNQGEVFVLQDHFLPSYPY
eukprot:jgi/Chrzof1/10053/Cz04g25140.t1